MTRRICCALAAAGFALALPLNCTPVLAASKAAKKEAAPAQGEAAQAEPAKGDAARRAYEGGVKSYTSGKYQNAVDQLNVAMKAGGLSATEMAKGLYYRGLAYKKLNKPGLAISDLTSALWLKNGLSETERKSATAERAEAYKAAGIAESENVERSSAPDTQAATPAATAQSPAKASAVAPAPVTAAPAPVPAAPSPAAASTAEGFPQPLTLGAETAAAPTPKYARTDDRVTSGAVYQAAGIDQPYSVGSSQSAGPAVPSATQPVPSAAPVQQAAASPAPASSGGSGIGGFFSNIFGGSSSPTQSPAAMQTASTGPAVPPPVTPQTSSWDSKSLTGSKTAAAKTAAPTPAAAKTAAAAVPAPVPAVKVKGGKYKVHIAAVRSRADADALAQKLNAEHAAAFNSRTASVDEAVIGSMGTFYRVRVGSYATPEEPRGLCNSLRNSGYDCLVVSN